MNQAEYDAIIQTIEKPQNEDTTYSMCFPFYEGSSEFLLPGRYIQQLKGNHSTLIFKGKAPRHPGANQ